MLKNTTFVRNKLLFICHFTEGYVIFFYSLFLKQFIVPAWLTLTWLPALLKGTAGRSSPSRLRTCRTTLPAKATLCALPHLSPQQTATFLLHDPADPALQRSRWSTSAESLGVSPLLTDQFVPESVNHQRIHQSITRKELGITLQCARAVKRLSLGKERLKLVLANLQVRTIACRRKWTCSQKSLTFSKASLLMLGQLYLRTLKKFSTDDKSFLVSFNQLVSDFRHCKLHIDFCTQCSFFNSCCDIFIESTLSCFFMPQRACWSENCSKLLHVNDFTYINLSHFYISLFDYICLQVHSEGVTETIVSDSNISSLNNDFGGSCPNREKDQARLTDHDFDEIHCTCCNDYISDNGVFRIFFQCVKLPLRHDLFVVINEWLYIIMSFCHFCSCIVQNDF